VRLEQDFSPFLLLFIHFCFGCLYLGDHSMREDRTGNGIGEVKECSKQLSLICHGQDMAKRTFLFFREKSSKVKCFHTL
jgi:hypothetical protein